MMQYRRFGRTELSMPVFSCGGMRYQHKWQDVLPEEIPAANQQNLEATIHRAVELGINHIETARGYGTSEMQLGRVLPTFPREKIIVQTKVAPTADPCKFLETFEKSMAYLRLDHVDLLSFHGINNYETLYWTIRKGGCLEVARKLQKEGRCRFLGFSTHGSCHLIQDAVNTGEFDYVNLHWYWINRSNWPAVLDARRQDMGIFIISPNDKGGKLYEPTPDLTKLCSPLSPMAFNNLFCLSRPEVHTLSVGAARPSDFDEHVASLQYYDKAAETMAPIETRLNGFINGTLGNDWLESWEKGLPDWEEAPGHVNIWEIVRLWTYAKALGMTEFGKMRYNLLGNAGHWFPGQKFHQSHGEAILQAIKDNPFPARILEALEEAATLFKGDEVKRLSES